MALKSQRLSDTKPARSPLRPTARQAAGWAGRAPSPKGAPWPPESRAGSSSSQGGTPKALEGGMQPPPPLQQPDFPVTFLAGCAGSSRPCAGFRVCTGSAHVPGLPSAHPSVWSEASCTPRWCQGRQMCLLHAQMCVATGSRHTEASSQSCRIRGKSRCCWLLLQFCSAGDLGREQPLPLVIYSVSSSSEEPWELGRSLQALEPFVSKSWSTEQVGSE